VQASRYGSRRLWGPVHAGSGRNGPMMCRGRTREVITQAGDAGGAAAPRAAHYGRSARFTTRAIAVGWRFLDRWIGGAERHRLRREPRLGPRESQRSKDCSHVGRPLRAFPMREFRGAGRRGALNGGSCTHSSLRHEWRTPCLLCGEQEALGTGVGLLTGGPPTDESVVLLSRAKTGRARVRALQIHGFPIATLIAG